MVVAVVQFRPGREADPADLRRHCHDHLAGYKCPKEFVVLDTLARSPSGKADYKLLRRKAARAVGVEVD